MESFNLSTVEYLQNQILPETIYHNLQPVNTNSAYNNNSSKKYLNCPEMNEESARNLLQLLEDWGFSYLYELFLDERMDVETLKTLNTTHLLNLCSSGKMQLGVAIKFETCLKKWQLMECTTESTESLMINEKMSKNNVYVKKILNDSPKGRLIINHFNKNNVLNDGCRAEILEIINNFLIQEEIKISSDLAKNISEQIVEEFPSEDLSMYYIKQPGKPAISKVSAKYYNAQRSLKCCGILGKRVYESRFSKSIKIRNEQCLHLEPEANHQESLVEIANDNCSFAELEYHWNATKNYRAKDVAVIELNCSEIINKWPHYKKPLGYKLVDIDFSNIYPNAGNILDKFGEFSAKILPVLNSKVKDCHNKKILEHIHNSSKSEKKSSKRNNNKEGEDMETTTASEMMDDNVDNKANDNDKDGEADDGYGDDEELHDEEEDEEPEFTETNFKFEEFIKRLLHPNIVRACTIMLTDWEQITSRALKSAVTILHRIAVGCKMPVMLFQASLFRIFQSVLNLKRDTHNEELQRIAKYIVRKFIEMAPNNPKIYAELLFYKNLKEAYDVEFNYEDHDVGGKNQWTEDDENQLRELFMENQRNPESDQDVIDWLTNNLSNKTRTRRAVIKKLKELNLIFKAPTKKTYAAAAAKFQWSVDQDTHLKPLYEEYRFDKAPLNRIFETFGSDADLAEGGKKRTKPALIKRMIELGLIADKSEIQPPRQKKSVNLNGMNEDDSDVDSNDDDDNDSENGKSEEEVDFNELRRALNPKQGEKSNKAGNSRTGGGGSKKIKKLSSLSKKASKKPKRPKQQIKPLNIAIVKQLIENLIAELPDAISWLQESFDDAAEEYDGTSTNPDDAVPIVPITEDQSNAFDNQKFIELLRELHINEPLKEMENFWRIPIHFTVNDLKIRSQLLTGLYEDTVLEQEINADDATRIDINEEGEESENEMNKTNSDNPFDKLRRIMYNNSDNDEDEDRSSGKSRFNFGRRNNFDKDTDNISVTADDSTNVNDDGKTDSENEELSKQMDDENVKIRKNTKRVNRLIDSSDSESEVTETTTKAKRQRLEFNDSDDDAMGSNIVGKKSEINSRKKVRHISSSSDE